MCTVTYIPQPNGFLLTSNRDESSQRLPASPPQWYAGRTGNLLYPKDGAAGGTWMVLHEQGHALVLLNGGFTKHEPAPPYRQSRGLVLLQLTDQLNPVAAFGQINLNQIEPFTAVICIQQRLFEAVWTGSEKFLQEISSHMAHIWSSATLYSPPVIQQRKEWFAAFLETNLLPGSNDILRFHQFAGNGNAENDIRMNRNNQLLTVSITSLQRQQQQSQLQYVDLLQQHQSVLSYTHTHTPQSSFLHETS